VIAEIVNNTVVSISFILLEFKKPYIVVDGLVIGISSSGYILEI
jgi:hypothetical protein